MSEAIAEPNPQVKEAPLFAHLNLDLAAANAKLEEGSAEDRVAWGLEHFSPRIVGLTGSEAEIAAMAKAWRAYYRVQGDPRANPAYLVDHSAFVYVMDAQGRFVGTFGPDTPLDAALRLVRRAL